MLLWWSPSRRAERRIAALRSQQLSEAIAAAAQLVTQTASQVEVCASCPMYRVTLHQRLGVDELRAS